ncbi:MAG: aldehyde dehydrogenase family protein, partial [Candidatus Competibacterales bacterium]
PAPASPWPLTENLARQDLPPGTFNVLLGGGGEVGEALIQSPLVDAISFTGSLAVGRRIAQAAAANLTKFQLEMGSKNPLVVLDDADMATAVQCAVVGGYSGTGQKCTASSRLIVHRKVLDAFTEALLARLKAMKVGHALAEGTEMGPVVSAAQLASNLNYIEQGQRQGAELLWGGQALELDHPGYYMSPALFANGRNDMGINREEMFGPMACIIPAADDDEALHMANDSEFGLTGGVVTRSLARATRFRRALKTGCVMVNLPTAGTDYHVPFGGRGNSSFGSREQGRYAEEFYTQVKTAYIHPGEV